MIVHFSRWQRQLAMMLAKAKRDHARTMGLQDRVVKHKFDRMEVEYLGVLGECAAAEVLRCGIHTDLVPDNGTDLADIVGSWTVKTCTKPYYNLMFALEAPMTADYAVLVLPIEDLVPKEVYDIDALDVYGYATRETFEKHSDLRTDIPLPARILKQCHLIPLYALWGTN